MSKHNKPSFVTEPSDSSLLYDKKHRRHFESPRRGEKPDNTAKSKFVETSPLNPNNITNVAVFNSSGEKGDPSDIPYLKNGNYTSFGSEGIRISESVPQLPLDREYNIYQAEKLAPTTEEISRKIHGTGDEVDPSAKRRKKQNFKRTPSHKMSMLRKKASKTEIKNVIQNDKESRSKETSTESIAQSNFGTQTDTRISYCRKCLLQSLAKQDVDSKASESKVTVKNVVKQPSVLSGENKIKANKGPNAYCTAVNVTLPPPIVPFGGDTSREASRVASIADLSKNKKSLGKRSLHEKSESIHQEIMNLKKAVDKSASNTTVHTSPSPLKALGKTGQIYRQIKKANKNGSLRYFLSMLIFAILLCWLVSATFHFEFVLNIFRSIGRHVSTLPIFITRRKKELSTAEILVKYFASFGRLLRSILIGTP